MQLIFHNSRLTDSAIISRYNCCNLHQRFLSSDLITSFQKLYIGLVLGEVLAVLILLEILQVIVFQNSVDIFHKILLFFSNLKLTEKKQWYFYMSTYHIRYMARFFSVHHSIFHIHIFWLQGPNSLIIAFP